MKIQVVYDSNHGKSKTVAQKFNFDVKHVNDFELWADIVLFICPTYGDEELPSNMEKFLINLKTENKLYVICELGNYYGYDDFEFGAKKIIEQSLNKLNWKKFHNGLSLDSMPNIDWNVFDVWKEGLENVLRNVRG